jgi:hypothetical protein
MKLPLPTSLRMRVGWPAITSLCYVTEGYVSSGYIERHRAVTVPKDARLKNAIVDKRKHIVKRPILDETFEAVALGPGLGLYVRDDTDIIAITGNTLTTNPIQLTKRLRYGVQPVNSNINTVISPSVTVEATTNLGSLSPGFTSTVTISLASNPTGASLSGTVTTNAVSGVATFNNLKITRSGEGFKFRATADGKVSKVSVAFDIPTRLTFTVQPDDTAPNTTLDPVEVTAKDTAGNTDTQYTGNITLATYSGGSGLIGTLTVAAVSGVASFANLEFTTTGTISLQASGSVVATAYPPAKQTSNAFVIGTSTHTLTAVEDTPTYFGFFVGGPGSISPTILNGQTIEAFFSAPVGTDGTWLRTTGINPALFTSVTANGITLLAADANFSGNSWNWPLTNMFTSAGSYPVIFA